MPLDLPPPDPSDMTVIQERIFLREMHEARKYAEKLTWRLLLLVFIGDSVPLVREAFTDTEDALTQALHVYVFYAEAIRSGKNPYYTP